MNRNQIIERIKADEYVEKLVSKRAEPAYLLIRDDIVAEIYLMICEVEPAKLESMYAKGGMDAVRGYINGIVGNQLASKRSNVYYRYRKNQKSTDSLDEIAETEISPDVLDDGEEVVQPRTFSELARYAADEFEATILRTYIECGYNFSATARAYGYNKKYISATIKLILRKMTGTKRLTT